MSFFTGTEGQVLATGPFSVGDRLSIAALGYAPVSVAAAASLGVIALDPEHLCIVRFEGSSSTAVAGIVVTCQTNPSEQLRSDQSGQVSLRVMAPYAVIATDGDSYLDQFDVAPGVTIVRTVTRSSAVVGFRNQATGQAMSVTCPRVSSFGEGVRPTRRDMVAPSSGLRLPSGSYRIEVDPAFEVAEDLRRPPQPGILGGYNVAFVDLVESVEKWIELAPLRCVQLQRVGGEGAFPIVQAFFEVLEEDLPELAGWVTIDPAPTIRVDGALLRVFGVDKYPFGQQAKSRLRLHFDGFHDVCVDRPYEHLGSGPIGVHLIAAGSLRLRLRYPDGQTPNGTFVVREVPSGSSRFTPGRIVCEGRPREGLLEFAWGGGDLKVARTSHPGAEAVAYVSGPLDRGARLSDQVVIVAAAGSIVATGDPGLVVCLDDHGIERPGVLHEGRWTFSDLESGTYTLSRLGAGNYRGSGQQVKVVGGQVHALNLPTVGTEFLRGHCTLVGGNEDTGSLRVAAFEGRDGSTISAHGVRDLRPVGFDGLFAIPDIGPESFLVFFARTPNGVLIPLDACRPSARCTVETATLRVTTRTSFGKDSFLLLEGTMRQCNLRSAGVRINLGQGREFLLPHVPCTNLDVTVHHEQTKRVHAVNTTAGGLVEIAVDT